MSLPWLSITRSRNLSGIGHSACVLESAKSAQELGGRPGGCPTLEDTPALTYSRTLSRTSWSPAFDEFRDEEGYIILQKRRSVGKGLADRSPLPRRRIPKMEGTAETRLLHIT